MCLRLSVGWKRGMIIWCTYRPNRHENRKRERGGGGGGGEEVMHRCDEGLKRSSAV